MQHRHQVLRALAPLVALTVVVVGCAGGAPAEPEPAAEGAADEQAAEEADEPEEEAEPEEPEPSPEPEAPAPEDVVAATAGPAGFDEAVPYAGESEATPYSATLGLLTNAPSPNDQVDRVVAGGFTAGATREWTRLFDEESRTEDAARVVVADFGSEDAAVAELEHLRSLADAAKANGVEEVSDVELPGDESFALAAAFGMVQIDPNTGQAESEPPLTTLGVIRSGQLVVLVRTRLHDAAADGGAAFAELAAGLGL